MEGLRWALTTLMIISLTTAMTVEEMVENWDEGALPPNRRKWSQSLDEEEHEGDYWEILARRAKEGSQPQEWTKPTMDGGGPTAIGTARNHPGRLMVHHKSVFGNSVGPG